MENFFISDIIEATGGKLLQGDSQRQVLHISTDSRSLKAGELFLALKGERFDGHDYVKEALDKGAIGTIVSKDLEFKPEKDRVIIKVGDTLKALEDMARIYRRRFKPISIAITGSNGKTTTKEMLASILSKRYKTLKNLESFNNEIGVPLTVFNLTSSVEVAIFELGMQGLGEIERLAQMVLPQVAIITNIGEAHLQYLGSIAKVAQAKGELLEALSEEGVAILNADDPWIRRMRERVKGKVLTFGLGEEAEIRATNIESLGDKGMSFTLKGRERYLIATLGYHNIYNALAAIATAYHLHLERELVQEGLRDFKPPGMRMEVINLPGVKLVNDAYNASPQSMRAAISSFLDLTRGKRRILVLGDMLELGKRTKVAHRELGEYVASLGVDLLVTVGPQAEGIAKAALSVGMEKGAILVCEKNGEAKEKIASQLRWGDAILVKGSRRMKMEEIVETLRAHLENQPLKVG